jgi:hypothetical protein
LGTNGKALMHFRAPQWALIGVILIGCVDQDPFHLSERRIVGEYRLKQWEDFATYYLVTPATRASPGGVIEGTVAQVGWTPDKIVVRSKPLMGDSTWVVINVSSGAMERSAGIPSVAKGVALRPAAAAWAELK